MGSELGEQFTALRKFSSDGVGRVGQDVKCIENPADWVWGVEETKLKVQGHQNG